jgi:hypothetical protein
MFPLLIALVFVAPVVTTGAVVSDNQKAFCEKALGGKYTPAGKDTNICPGGSWGNLIYGKPEEIKQSK